ncbi:class I SAM-dependent methyltransferase [Hanstruepera marina]|uniref:class I SAM-dependent methyltransferase n=1 Tax=Hanstruepera marina TaxID=2873265 RepID=UPI001CA76619|nr:class I SAM-dependent methyltransferase [Hanstruepera marina]
MKEKKQFLNVKDHSVTGEEFQLIYNIALDMLETHPQPLEEQLGLYYKTDDYISHTDSKRNVMEHMYHTVRQFTLKRKVKLINKYSKKGKSLLDIGCGTGDFLQTAKKNGWQIIGIEPDEDARAIANSKTDNVVLGSNSLFELKNNQFDVITLWHVLEHLPNLEKHISVFNKLLKPNGTLIIAVPNFNSYDAKYYKAFWAAYDVPRHLWHFSKTAISKLFERENFSVVKVKPMLFDSFYVSLLSEKYKSGSMNLIRAFCVGLLSNIKGISTKEYSSHVYILKKQ